MSQDPEKPRDLSGLEMDLLKSFQPAWVKDSSSGHGAAQFSEFVGSGRNEDRFSGDRDDSNFRRDRKPPKSQRMTRRPGEEPAGKTRRPPGDSQPGKRPPFRKDGPRESRPPSEASRGVPVLQGWEIRFLPEPRGVEGLVKQIKSTAKAYALFELARLVLEKSPRYLIEFRRKDGPAFFQCVKDGTLWLQRGEAVKWILQKHLYSYYRCETVEVEAPKGDYPVIAQCGMSGVYLGPPNHHDYQLNLRKIYSERFTNVAFDIYKARIRMLRDEEYLANWKKAQSTREVFYPLDVPEGTEAPAFQNLAEVEDHFLKTRADSEIMDPGAEFTVPGPVAVNDSTPTVIEFTRRELDNLIRFPLPMAHILGQEFNKAGLQIFKAHENITYVSVARPRPLDRVANPVSASLSAILDYLESHPGEPRAKQWQALLETVVLAPGAEESTRETALLRDFYWLLLQGHVVDYATKGLEIPRRQTAAPRPPKKTKPAPVAPEAAKSDGSNESVESVGSDQSPESPESAPPADS